MWYTVVPRCTADWQTASITFLFLYPLSEHSKPSTWPIKFITKRCETDGLVIETPLKTPLLNGVMFWMSDLSGCLKVVFDPPVVRRWTENDVSLVGDDVSQNVQTRSAAISDEDVTGVNFSLGKTKFRRDECREERCNSRKSVTWSAVPVAPALTFFWLREGKLGQRPWRGR